MKRKIALTAAAAMGVAMMAGPAVAMPEAPGDGQCVSSGVTALGGEAIAAAATGNLLSGVDDNLVNTVILDHVFNNANVTESLLGITICE